MRSRARKRAERVACQLGYLPRIDQDRGPTTPAGGRPPVTTPSPELRHERGAGVDSDVEHPRKAASRRSMVARMEGWWTGNSGICFARSPEGDRRGACQGLGLAAARPSGTSRQDRQPVRQVDVVSDRYYTLHPVRLPCPDSGVEKATIVCGSCGQTVRCKVYSISATERAYRRTFAVNVALLLIMLIGIAAFNAVAFGDFMEPPNRGSCRRRWRQPSGRSPR